MKKTNSVKQIIENNIVTTFCDVCGNEIKYHLNTCCMCGIDLCNDCVNHIDEYSGDYPDKYCATCWNDIGEKYRTKINELENEISKLHIDWKNECIKK